MADCSEALKRREHDKFRICLNLCLSKIHCYGHPNFEGLHLFKWVSGIRKVIARLKALEKASKIDSSLASFEHDVNVCKECQPRKLNAYKWLCVNMVTNMWLIRSLKCSTRHNPNLVDLSRKQVSNLAIEHLVSVGWFLGSMSEQEDRCGIMSKTFTLGSHNKLLGIFYLPLKFRIWDPTFLDSDQEG